MSRVVRVVTLLAISVLLSASTVHAQQHHLKLNINVPFEFSIGSHTFPAGEYWITSVGAGTLALRDADQHVLTAVQTIPTQASDIRSTSALKFRMVNGRRVLSEIWEEGTRYGFQLESPKPAVSVAQSVSETEAATR